MMFSSISSVVKLCFSLFGLQVLAVAPLSSSAVVVELVLLLVVLLLVVKIEMEFAVIMAVGNYLIGRQK